MAAPLLSGDKHGYEDETGLSTGNVPSDSRPLPELAGINALRSLTLYRGYPEPIFDPAWS